MSKTKRVSRAIVVTTTEPVATQWVVTEWENSQELPWLNRYAIQPSTKDLRQHQKLVSKPFATYQEAKDAMLVLIDKG